MQTFKDGVQRPLTYDNLEKALEEIGGLPLMLEYFTYRNEYHIPEAILYNYLEQHRGNFIKLHIIKLSKIDEDNLLLSKEGMWILKTDKGCFISFADGTVVL